MLHQQLVSACYRRLGKGTVGAFQPLLSAMVYSGKAHIQAFQRLEQESAQASPYCVDMQALVLFGTDDHAGIYKERTGERHLHAATLEFCAARSFGGYT